MCEICACVYVELVWESFVGISDCVAKLVLYNVAAVEEQKRGIQVQGFVFFCFFCIKSDH